MNTDQLIKELKKNKNYDKFEYDYSKKYESNSGIKVIAAISKETPEKKVWDYKKKNGNECITLVDNSVSPPQTFSPKVNNTIMEFYQPKSQTPIKSTPTKSTPSKASFTVSTSPPSTTKTTTTTPTKSNKLDFNKVEEEDTSDNEYEDANGGIDNQEEEEKSHNSDDSDNENMFEQDDYEDNQDEIKLPKPEQEQELDNQNEKQIQNQPLEDDLIDDLCSQLENVLDFLSKQECTAKNADISYHTRKFLKQLKK